MIEIALTEPQERFCFSEAKHPAIVGGLGSGKSEAGILRLLLLMLENVTQTGKKIDTLITFPTYDLCKLRGMSGLEDVLERLGFAYKTNKSEFSTHIENVGTMLFRSYDRPERIVAFQVAHSIADELDTLPKEKAALVWRKISERTRQKAYRPNSIGAVTTPDQGVNGFVYHRWVKQADKSTEIVKAATYSNPYLPDGYVEQIRLNYDPTLVELYLNGEFVSLSANKVYHYFKRETHHSDRTITPDDKVIHVGLDFNVGGCVAVAAAIENTLPVIVDELVEHDTQAMAIALNARYAGKKIIVYPDASGRKNTTNASQSDVSILEQSGLQVEAPPANPPIRDRINSLNALLSHGKIKINTDKCQHLTHALESQGYTEKGEPEKFNDHPAIDDYCDALGYFIHRRWPINRPLIQPTIRM